MSGPEAEPSAAAAVLAPEALTLPPDLLDGGEIILLAIKPSLWFVALDSMRWVAAAALIVAGSAWLAGGLPQLSQLLLVQAAVVVAGGRLCVGSLRWATRHYVLTNRRVISIAGVMRPRICVCPLRRVRETRVVEAPQQRWLQIGTLHFEIDDALADTAWSDIARPHDVHAVVRRAIERATHGPA